MKDKLFVVKKYIMAKSTGDAIKKEKQCLVFDVYIDDDYKEVNEIGFKINGR